MRRGQSRIKRQCDIVERYDLNHESRDAISRDLRISSRTFYYDRSYGIAQIYELLASNRGAFISSQAEPLLEKERLAIEAACEKGDFVTAGVGFSRIAATSDDIETKVIALARLAGVLCGQGQIENADASLRAARNLLKKKSGLPFAELLTAEARVAFERQDGRAVDSALDCLLEMTSALALDAPSRLWVLLGWTQAIASDFNYHNENRTRAIAQAKAVAAALSEAKTVPLDVRSYALTVTGTMSMLDDSTLQRVGAENAAAFTLAREVGLDKTACDALYNIYCFSFYSDFSLMSVDDNQSAWKLHTHASNLARELEDRALTALVAAELGDFAHATSVLLAGSLAWDRIEAMSPGDATLLARLLYKNGSYRASEYVSRIALSSWNRAAPSRIGIALRVRAEALAALGDTKHATTTALEAIEMLEPDFPRHHLLGAYRCAARLTKNPHYVDRAENLARLVREAVDIPPAALCDQPRIGLRGTESTRIQSLPRRLRLTPMQLRVAEMAAAGHPNRTIAAALGITSKTVANHLSSVFDRLRIHSRRQITRDVIADARARGR